MLQALKLPVLASWLLLGAVGGLTVGLWTLPGVRFDARLGLSAFAVRVPDMRKNR